MTKRNIVWALIVFIFIITLTYASDNVLVIDYTIDKNDKITINRIEACPGDILIKESLNDEYRIEIRDKYNTLIRSINTSVIFYVFDIGEINESSVYFRIPMKDNYRFVEFIHNDEIIFEADLSEYICNKNDICEPERGESQELCFEDCKPLEVCGNNRCDSLENYGSCPIDCASGYPDDYCDALDDGICDPDCKSGEDPDCKEEIINYDYIPYITLILIIITLLIYLKFRKK